MDSFMKYSFDIQDIVVACYVPSGGGTPVHQNRSSHGIVLYTGGKTVFSFDRTKTMSVCENEIAYLPKGSSYSVTSSGKCGCFAVNFQLFKDASFSPFKFKIKNQSGFAELFKSIEEEWRLKGSGYEMKCKALLYNILFDMRREYELGYISKNKAGLISPALDYIHEQYTADNIDISHIAEMCNMSEAYFRRIFLKSFGISPVKYINNLKINRAKELIASGLCSISEAAAESGFHDDSYFSRKFKQITGISPSEYRVKKTKGL